MLMTLSAAFGGAIGAVSRYGLSHICNLFFNSHFPYATIIINVSGSFLLGLLFEVIQSSGAVNNGMRLFFITGILSSFTTFSAFSLEVVTLMIKGNFFIAAIYIISSLFLSFLFLYLGTLTPRFFV
jgi:CrcB protein